MKKWNFLMLAAATMFTFASCDKSDTDWTFASDNATSEDAFQDVYKVSNHVGEGNEGDLRTGCVTITHTADTLGQFPDTTVLDFGTTGCVGADGRIRKGKLTVILSGRWRDQGTVATATSDGYTVNGYLVAGTQTVTNTGLNNAGHPTFNVVVSNAQVTNPQAQTNTWSSNCTVEWTEGFATTGPGLVADDVFSITGGGSGTSHTNISYTVSITEAIVHKMNCRWPVDGVVQVTPTGGRARTIDFGDGTCDAQLTVSYGRFTTTLNLIQ